MAGLYEKNQTDSEKEKDGARFEYDLNSKDEKIVFIVAREGGRNLHYQKVAEQIFKPYRRQIQHGQINPQTLDSLLAEVYSKTVVKGWEGVEDENNNSLPFSPENCLKLLNDLPVVFDAIKEFARDYTRFLIEEAEADAKN